ncbi:MAG: choice-of-anchor D domain-containing protein, partial [Spartobacteria bacterium]|nr:choice-of-anchor D domain-containing protein [Spartobacteria bacterium]
LSDPSDFSISGVPATVDIGAVSNFSVTYTPTTIGNHSAFVVFTNNTPDSPFTLNLAGACFGLSTNVGPYAGGNTITITNGYFGAITNVLVDGIDVSAIVDSGVNWVNVVMPLLGAAGTVDITIQTSDNGAITLANAYTYNPTGEIGEYGPVEYRVYSGFSMSQGYYTNTSPDGTYLWNYYRGGWMELRSTNEVAGGAWMRLNGWNGGFAGGGWDTSLGGYDWIGSNTALYVLDSYSSSIHTNYIEVTNLVGGSYQVDVVSSFQDDEYTQTMTMVSGVYQPGDLADNGNYGNWPSGGNTNAGLNLRPYYIYQTRTNYVTWTNAQTTDKALSVVFTKQETEGNLFNNMRIRGLGVIASGVAPSSGFWTGGYPVVISGTNLCNGNVSDVTNVTLAGTAASIDSVSGNTQIVVIVSASPAASGDVVIHSISHGTTIKSNAFTYLEPRMLALGTNGAAMASDAAAGSANGTDFGDLIVGVGALTNTFSITNSGNTALTISGVSTSGAGASSFSLQLSSFSLPAGAAEDFSVVFEPDGGDAKVAALNFANDSTTGVYVVNLAGFGLGGGIALGTNQLAYTATYNGTDPVDQTLMMTNVGVSGFTYTNLHVYGGNASNWLAVAPGAGTVALASSVELTNAVSISGLNAGLYSCGVQITAPDATNSPQSYMVELTVNKADQTISFPHPGAQETTNVVAIAPTATSGLTVDVSVVSGPG